MLLKAPGGVAQPPQEGVRAIKAEAPTHARCASAGALLDLAVQGVAPQVGVVLLELQALRVVAAVLRLVAEGDVFGWWFGVGEWKGR